MGTFYMAVWLPHNGMMPIFLGKILREVEINKKRKREKKKTNSKNSINSYDLGSAPALSILLCIIY